MSLYTAGVPSPCVLTNNYRDAAEHATNPVIQSTASERLAMVPMAPIVIYTMMIVARTRLARPEMLSLVLGSATRHLKALVAIVSYAGTGVKQILIRIVGGETCSETLYATVTHFRSCFLLGTSSERNPDTFTL